jgi:uncharacterized protein YpbB
MTDKRIWTPGQEEQKQPSTDEILIAGLQQHTMQLAHINNTMHMLGEQSDTSALTLKMILKLLIDKEIISSENLDKLYKTEVIDEYKRLDEEMKAHFKKMEEERAQQLKEQLEKNSQIKDANIKTAENVINNVTQLRPKE